MTHTRSTIAAALLALGLLAAGCGDDADPSGDLGGDVGRAGGSKGASQVLTTIGTSLPDGDGPRTCSLLSPHVQRSLEARVKAGNCIAAVSMASKALTPAQAEDLARLDYADVQADGDAATATGDGAAALAEVLGVDKLTLERVELHWQVG